MIVEFRKRFLKDIRQIKDDSIKARIRDTIQAIESADDLTGFPNLKKLKGYSDYYRLRLGDFRMGIKAQGDTVVFLRFLHRKDIYRFFP